MRRIVPAAAEASGTRSATVSVVVTPQARHAARLRARRRRTHSRTRRVALVLLLVALAAVVAVLIALDEGSRAPSDGPLLGEPITAPTTRPDAQLLATIGSIRILSPVAQGAVTRVGFHDAQGGGLVMHPTGPQANEGLIAGLWRRIAGRQRSGLAWYRLENGELRALAVGASPGTDVFAPVDGTVVAIRDEVVSGTVVGSQVELRPSSAPSLVVVVGNVRPDPNLAVGANVAAGSSKLGTVADVTFVETPALGRFTSDGGNNVSIEVYPAATLTYP